MKQLRTLIFFLLLVLGAGCTKLDEKVYTDLYKENFYKSRTEVLQAALRPMTHLQSWLAHSRRWLLLSCGNVLRPGSLAAERPPRL
jgi:hypothetical protein